MENGYRQLMQALQAQMVAQQQLLARVRQVQEWSMSNGVLSGGQDADSYRLRREQVQQQLDRQRHQHPQGQRHGH